VPTAGGEKAGDEIVTTLDLFKFTPFRLNRLAAEVSCELATEYADRHGLDIPEWRVIATLGFHGEPCSAQFIAHSTRTHKSTISRAVTALLERGLLERTESETDRRAFQLRLSRKGLALYRRLIPKLLRKEEEILDCLSARERVAFAAALGKIEQRLGLVQEASEEKPY
jgi:DNA-binding MarR family transcriptional regulator